jgi:hypothetical protein
MSSTVNPGRRLAIPTPAPAKPCRKHVHDFVSGYRDDETSLAEDKSAEWTRAAIDMMESEGPIGDSVLAEPTTGLVRADLLKDKMLIFVLNDRDKSQQARIGNGLGWWWPKADSYPIRSCDSAGKPSKTISAHGSEWSGTTRRLAPGESAIHGIREKQG